MTGAVISLIVDGKILRPFGASRVGTAIAAAVMMGCCTWVVG